MTDVQVKPFDPTKCFKCQTVRMPSNAMICCRCANLTDQQVEDEIERYREREREAKRDLLDAFAMAVYATARESLTLPVSNYWPCGKNPTDPEIAKRAYSMAQALLAERTRLREEAKKGDPR